MNFTPKYLTIDEFDFNGLKVIAYINIEESIINSKIIFSYKYKNKSISVKNQKDLTIKCSRNLSEGKYDLKSIERHLNFKLNIDTWKAKSVKTVCPHPSCDKVFQIDPTEYIITCPCGKMFEAQ